MAAEITLPGVGPVDRKLLIGGGALVLLVAVVMYYRKQRQNQTAAAAAASGGSAATDPETGYPQGSPEDQAALAALAASAGTGGVYGGSSGTATTPTVPAGTGLATNAQWSQAAITYLTDLQGPGMDGGTVSSALGAYLAGESLTTAQTDIVHQAIAVEGPPPVAAADGYPPNLRPVVSQPPAGGGGTGGPGTPKVGATFEGPWMVQRGQTKQSIASHFGLTTDQLDKANPGATYQPGSLLMIPWWIQAGQTMQYIANAFEIPVAQISPYVPVN